MTSHLQRLEMPQNPESEIWVDEAIWGHRLYDEQTPWLCFLEFLGIVQSELLQSRALIEIEDNRNNLKYAPARKLYLRNILFNNPYLESINSMHFDDNEKWKEWCDLMNRSSGGIGDPDFTYLREKFQNFSDFTEVIRFLQSSAIEGDSNKRWSSKFVFPYGPNCLYEDLRVSSKDNKVSNDRRFFARTGEILYLMLCRSSKSQEVLNFLIELKIVCADKESNVLTKWDRLVRKLEREVDSNIASESRKPPYLPYSALPDYDELAEDWLHIGDCNMPDFDALPHIVQITGLHMLIYYLRRAKEILNIESQPSFVLEIVAPRKTFIRTLASDSYLENNNYSERAIKAYIEEFKESESWKNCHDAGVAMDLMEKKFAWPSRADRDKFTEADQPERILQTLLNKAISRHKQHISKFHSSWSKEIGLATRRGSRRNRYAPSDSLLKSLVLTNVSSRMEFQEVLDKLYRKYGIIIGDKQAGTFIKEGLADQEVFSDNALRLEERLASIGLLKRLSDACAYVKNPFAKE